MGDQGGGQVHETQGARPPPLKKNKKYVVCLFPLLVPFPLTGAFFFMWEAFFSFWGPFSLWGWGLFFLLYLNLFRLVPICNYGFRYHAG